VDLCDREGVEVLLIAGDLFDNVYRAEDVCAAIDLLKTTVGPFLRRGGTILAVTGNHDGETFSATLQQRLGVGRPFGPPPRRPPRAGPVLPGDPARRCIAWPTTRAATSSSCSCLPAGQPLSR